MKTQLMERSNSATFALALAQHIKKNNSEEGFSLLESLMAIVVAAVIISFISAPLFLAAGTRIQNRRAEQALQLAQAEVDRVKRLVDANAYTEEAGSYLPTSLPPIGSSKVEDQGAPSGSTTDPKSISASTGLKVDVNGDGVYDFVVQTFRNEGVRQTSSGTPRTVGFNMGVRVYAAVVDGKWGKLDNPPKKAASLKLTTALGSQQRLPLAVMYTSIIRSDTGDSLDNLRKCIDDRSCS